MFIAVYEFDVHEGREEAFREAWLKVTRTIHQQCGSLGSRLHKSDEPNIMVAYAQWPSRQHWERARDVDTPELQHAFEEMRACLLQSKTVYGLEVSDDYLQSG